MPDIVRDGSLILNLKNKDFTTSSRIAEVINKHFKGYFAESLSSSHLKVLIPPLYENRVVDFIGEMELLKVRADIAAVVVMNERTGTVVMGGSVVIAPVAISHGNLSIQVGEGQEVRGENVVPIQGTTVNDLIKSLNAMGIRPPDLVGILQAVHSAGALKADLRFL